MRWKVGTRFRFRNDYNNQIYKNPIVTKIQKSDDNPLNPLQIWFSYETSREGAVYIELPALDDKSPDNTWYGIIVGDSRKEFTDKEYEELLV